MREGRYNTLELGFKINLDYGGGGELLTLSNELLDQFRARHSDEGAVSVVGYSSGQKGLSSTWGSIQEHTLQGFKHTRFMKLHVI